MHQKETFATSGTHITACFFGGWDYADEFVNKPGMAKAAYAGGVPMGGDLKSAPRGKAPKFIVAAMKDPDGANLDRIQIIKGWVDKAGQTHEKIYDVVWACDRKPGADGKLPPIGNTVDEKKATYANSIGAPELSKVWTDPDFDPAIRALYYARVLEIPTPRWSTYDSARYGVKAPAGVQISIQERAWTSPIWFTPGK